MKPSSAFPQKKELRQRRLFLSRLKILALSLFIFILSFSVFSVLAYTYSNASLEQDASPFEQPSPGDWIKEDQIIVYDDKVILNLRDSSWAKFTDTNSMDPFIDAESNALEIMPDSPDRINVGDVISYQNDDSVIIHRVIYKGNDDDGIYYLVKGDNTTKVDPQKVRFSDVKGVVVAVIY
jgi:hypothetical protein